MLGSWRHHFIISSMTVLVRQRWTRSYAAGWYAVNTKTTTRHRPDDRLLTFSQGPPVEARTMPS